MTTLQLPDERTSSELRDRGLKRMPCAVTGAPLVVDAECVRAWSYGHEANRRHRMVTSSVNRPEQQPTLL